MGDDFVSMGGGRLEILLRWGCGTEGDTSKLHTRPEENDMRWLPPLLGVQPCTAQMARQPRIQQQARGNKMEKDCIDAKEKDRTGRKGWSAWLLLFLSPAVFNQDLQRCSQAHIDGTSTTSQPPLHAFARPPDRGVPPSTRVMRKMTRKKGI